MYVTLRKKTGILKVHLLCPCSKGREFQDLNQRQLITITLAIILKKLRYIGVVINIKKRQTRKRITSIVLLGIYRYNHCQDSKGKNSSEWQIRKAPGSKIKEL